MPPSFRASGACSSTALERARDKGLVYGRDQLDTLAEVLRGFASRLESTELVGIHDALKHLAALAQQNPAPCRSKLSSSPGLAARQKITVKCYAADVDGAAGWTACDYTVVQNGTAARSDPKHNAKYHVRNQWAFWLVLRSSDGERLAEDLVAIVSGEAEMSSDWPSSAPAPRLAAELSDRLVRLTRTAAVSRATQRREWAVRGLCVVAGVLALSLVLGNVGASSVSVAGVQVAAPAPVIPAPAEAHAADETWANLAKELDGKWERDWPQTIALLDGFLKRWPTYAVAQDKLYAALVADGDGHIQAGQVSTAVDELERAARLLPERPVAWALLAQLATRK